VGVSETSFDDSDLLVKSLQHVLKHFSTSLPYIVRKPWNWAFRNSVSGRVGDAGQYLALLDELIDVGLLCVGES
jgi:hypothetical protein